MNASCDTSVSIDSIANTWSELELIKTESQVACVLRRYTEQTEFGKHSECMKIDVYKLLAFKFTITHSTCS